MGQEEVVPPATYRFAGFVLDLARVSFTGPDGREIPLRPKAMEVLRLLVEQAGRVVSREQILEAVWPGIFVTDDSVTQCVTEIRRGLGERAAVLRTVPKRGYILDAEVVRSEAAATAPTRPAVEPAGEVADGPPRAEAAPGRGGASAPFRRAAGPAAVLLLTLGVAAWWSGRASDPGPREAVPVAAAPPPQSPPQSPPVTAAEEPPAPTPRQRAVRLTREAWGIARDGSACRPRFLEARSTFERAIAADAGFGPAYAGAALTYANAVGAEVSVNPAADLREGEVLARRAVELDPNSSDAHSALGGVLYLSRRHAEALAAYRRAVALDGSAAAARVNLGRTLLALGRAEEAGDPIRASLATGEPSPVPPGGWLDALGMVDLHLGRGDQGAENFRRSLALGGPLPREVRQLHFAAALALGGRLPEARAVAADVSSRQPGLGIAWFRSRAESDHPAYLAGRERLHHGLSLAGLGEGDAHWRETSANPSCVPGPATAERDETGDGPAPPTSARAEAVRLYREGNAAFWRGACNAGWAEARAIFARAIAADPTLVVPYTQSAFAIANLVRNGGSTDREADLREAERLAERAIALAPRYPGAHAAQGSVLNAGGRLEEALAALRRALALDGAEHPARANIGQTLIRLGRAEEAEAPLLASIALNPGNTFRRQWQASLGQVDFLLGRGDFGATQFRRAIALPGGEALEEHRLLLAAALARGGRVEDARAVVADVLTRQPWRSIARFRRGVTGAPRYLEQQEALYRALALAGLPEGDEADDRQAPCAPRTEQAGQQMAGPSAP